MGQEIEARVEGVGLKTQKGETDKDTETERERERERETETKTKHIKISMCMYRSLYAYVHIAKYVCTHYM